MGSKLAPPATTATPNQDCKLDVEKMDTTFKDKTSKHNIHSVKCVDCHEKGIPKKKEPLVAEN